MGYTIFQKNQTDHFLKIKYKVLDHQKQGRVASVIHGSSYSQVAVEQTDADGVATGSFIHAAIPVDICKKMELTKGNIVTCIFPAASVILAKHD